MALLCYFVAVAGNLWAAGNATGNRWRRISRQLWTAGCLAYVIHVICAFQFYHSWSHSSAWEDTARQTADVTGWKWGGGIWFNYLFTLAWIADVIRLWRNTETQSDRFGAIVIIWQTFFFFMIFNATIVFESGPVRWFGAAGCLAIAVLFIRSKRKAE